MTLYNIATLILGAYFISIGRRLKKETPDSNWKAFMIGGIVFVILGSLGVAGVIRF
jgi:hypothetical protein